MFKVGDLVNFAKRCQSSIYMIVQEVDTNMFDTKIKVNGKWWTPKCFISHEEWKKQRNT